jgi:hypothetical protein
MPDHLSNDRAPGDGTKLAAVSAEQVQTHYTDLSAVGLQPVDHLDVFAVLVMLENNDISPLKAIQKEGDFDHQHKIPFLIIRVQAVACYSNPLQHYRLG